MEAEQIAALIAARNEELAALVKYINSRPAIRLLFDGEDLIIQIRKAHALPTVKWSGQASVNLDVQLQA